METVSAILAEKGEAVFSVRPGSTVLEAVDEMCRRHVGAMLVCEDGRPLGMFSERDLMTRVVLRQRDAAATRVDDVMTREVAGVGTTATVTEAMAVMTQRRCRHLPVMLDGRVVGVVSIGDLVRHASRHQEYEIRLLHDYVLGKYPG
jgi:signal-transduction protein with cAMP-binding, CBS, and nucleotidyltransferase domain